MKNLIAFAFLCLFLASCQEPAEIVPEPEPTTGILILGVNYDGQDVKNALIGISKDQPVSEEHLFLMIKSTDEDGRVSFELEPGEYFWQVKFPEDPEYDHIGGTPRRFVDIGLGSYELKAGDNLGGPVFIVP